MGDPEASRIEDAITNSFQPLELLSHRVVSCSHPGNPCSVIWVDRDGHPVHLNLLFRPGQAKDVGTVLEAVQASHDDVRLVSPSWRWL